MKIAVIGTGYVGLVSGACFAEFGIQTVCVDKLEGKIEQLSRGEIPIYEPGLEQVVKRNFTAGRLRFDTDLEKAVDDADVIFICVGTPMGHDRRADLSAIFAVATRIAQAIKKPGKVLVSESTIKKAALRLITQGLLVSSEIDYIQRTLGTSATQQEIEDTVVAVRKMPWASFAHQD